MKQIFYKHLIKSKNRDSIFFQKLSMNAFNDPGIRSIKLVRDQLSSSICKPHAMSLSLVTWSHYSSSCFTFMFHFLNKSLKILNKFSNLVVLILNIYFITHKWKSSPRISLSLLLGQTASWVMYLYNLGSISVKHHQNQLLRRIRQYILIQLR